MLRAYYQLTFAKMHSRHFTNEMNQNNKVLLVSRREDHEYLLKFLLVGDSDVGKNEITDSLQAIPASTSSASFMCKSYRKSRNKFQQKFLVRFWHFK